MKLYKKLHEQNFQHYFIRNLIINMYLPYVFECLKVVNYLLEIAMPIGEINTHFD